MLQDKWMFLAEALVKYATHKQVHLRQSACYAIGIFAEKTPVAHFATYSQTIVNVLLEAMKVEKGSEIERSYSLC